MTFVKKYVGDKTFYRKVLTVVLPIMAQNGITNFVSLLDNVMVGRLGTEAMSAVSIINQFVFVFNLLIFGAVSAAGIFTAQYYGEGNREGVRDTFRFKIVITAVVSLLAVGAMWAFRLPMIELFLYSGETGDLALTLNLAQEYLLVILFGFVPFALAQSYTSSLRETDEPAVPLYASLAAVVTNFVLNIVLIFGVGDVIPALGVVGAAIATSVSRLVECLILMSWSHRHTERCSYLIGAYRMFRIPGCLLKDIILRGMPIMANELFWSLAITLRNQSYATRGLDVVAAQNISGTIFNLFSIVYLSMGSALSILIGHLLGAGKIEEAKDQDRKLIAFSVFCSVATAFLIILSSPFIPLLYNTTDGVRAMASEFMVIAAVYMPFDAFVNSAYFTLRTGGRVFFTILSDSIFMWVVVVPITFALSRFTSLPIMTLYLIGQGCDILKAVFGFTLLKKVRWANCLTNADKESISIM